MSQTIDNSQSNPVSFDAVQKELFDWRSTKPAQGGHAIPDALWLNIFNLESLMPASAIRSSLSLNSAQYKKKKTALAKTSQMQPSPSKSTEAVSNNSQKSQEGISPVFSKVTVAPPSTTTPINEAPRATDAVRQLKSTRASSSEQPEFVSTETLIIECIHQNGSRLKIHTTHKSIQAVMAEFFNQEISHA